MRILLTSHCHPSTIGGTQSWVKTVADEISRRNHYCFWYSFPNEPVSSHYDLAIVSQNSTFEGARARAAKVLFVSHGIGELEKPSPEVTRSAFVSEECLEYWAAEAPRLRVGTVIRQPIDTEFWSPDPDVEPTWDVLRVSNYGGMEWLPGLCKEMGLSFMHASDLEPRPLLHHVRRARVVVAVGRSALEAMSCGCRVVFADERLYNGGPTIDTSWPAEAIKRNYSGRGEWVTPDIMRSALISAWREPRRGDVWRRHVVEEHRVTRIVDELLELAA